MILLLCTDCCCFLKGGFSFSQKNFLYLSSEKGSYLRIKKKGGGVVVVYLFQLIYLAL